MSAPSRVTGVPGVSVSEANSPRPLPILEMLLPRVFRHTRWETSLEWLITAGDTYQFFLCSCASQGAYDAGPGPLRRPDGDHCQAHETEI